MTRARQGFWALSLWALAQACVCAPDGDGAGEGPRQDASAGEPDGEEANPLDESEPNDAPERATPFALIPQAPGSPVLRPMEGALDGDDVDWYAIPPQGGEGLRAVRVESAAKDVNLILLLGDAQGRRDVAPAGKAEELPNLRGELPLLVGVTRDKPDARAIAYKLWLARSPQRPQGLEAEPTSEGGEPLKLPQTKQGLLQTRGDVDLWRIAPGDGDSADPARPARVEFKPPAGANLRLTIRWKDQPLVERELSPDEAKPLAWADLPQPTEEAPLWVEVALLGEAPGLKDAYTLSANLAPAPGKGELVAVEPNDPERPLPLPLSGDLRLLGWLWAQDQDAFELTVPDPGEGPPLVARAVLTGLDGLSPWLSLEGPGGSPERLRRGEEGAELVMCDRPLAPGVWRWGLGHSSGALDTLLGDGGDKKRGEPPAPSPTSDRYVLHLTTRAAQHEEVEPNDAQARATALPPDQPSRGHLYPKGDADLWAFSIEGPALPPDAPPAPDGAAAPADAAQGLRPVKVEAQDPARDLVLELLDEDGVSVARADASPAAGGERLQVDLPPGSYLVKLTAKGEATCGEPYRVTVQGR